MCQYGFVGVFGNHTSAGCFNVFNDKGGVRVVDASKISTCSLTSDEGVKIVTVSIELNGRIFGVFLIHEAHACHQQSKEGTI